MNRVWVMLSAIVLGCVMPAGTASGAERASPEGITQLILVFFSDVSRGLIPKRVVAEDKDWKIVKKAEAQQDARQSHEERRREAYKLLEERERAARSAREEYRRETRNMLLTGHHAWSPRADEQGRDARKAQEERLRAAEQRMHEREREARRAKEEYQHVARLAREERRREAERPRLGG